MQRKQRGQLGTWTVLLPLRLLSCEQSPFGKKTTVLSEMGTGLILTVDRLCDCPRVISAPKFEIKIGPYYSAVLFLAFPGLLHGKSIKKRKKSINLSAYPLCLFEMTKSHRATEEGLFYFAFAMSCSPASTPLHIHGVESITPHRPRCAYCLFLGIRVIHLMFPSCSTTESVEEKR